MGGQTTPLRLLHLIKNFACFLTLMSLSGSVEAQQNGDGRRRFSRSTDDASCYIHVHVARALMLVITK
jgi:hypothetical protein